MMRATLAALVTGLASICVALVVVLSGSPVAVIASNGIATPVAAYIHGNHTVCQHVSTLPAGTSAIRESFSANVGPKVTLRILSGGRTIAQGSVPAGWGISESVTVPIHSLSHSIENVRICAKLGASGELIEVKGTGSTRRRAGGGPREPSSLRLRIEYLKSGSKSWWSLASSVVRHMGFGRAPTGTVVAILALVLLLAVVGWTSGLILWDLR